jgi:soluble lytic murein transglycosylase
MISLSITAACGCRFFALALLGCGISTLARPSSDPGPEPLSAWLDALTRAAAAAGSDPAAAEASARAALRARPRGEAAARSQIALGAALRALGRDAEAALAFAAAAGIPEPYLVAAAELEESRARGAAAGAAAVPPPGPPPAAPPAERLRRAESLLATAQVEEAMAELDAADAAAPDPRAGARSAALRALALLARGRTAEAGRAARRALESGAADPGSAAAAELALARIAAREGRHAEAISLYRRLARRRAPVPGLAPQQQRELPEDASFLAAWLPYDAGHFAEASRSLRAWHLAHPGARRADDARWFEAWSTVRTGNLDRAREALARLVPGPLEAAALYWQARLAVSPAAQRRLYRRARAAAGPDGWYGLLAAARLSALGAGPAPWRLPPGSPPGDGPGPGARGQALARAVELFAAGLPAAARAEMAALAASRGVRPVAARLAQLAAFSGDPELPARLARDHLPASRRALRWAHPDAWPDRLPALAAAAGVDRQLLLAVVRRESSFRGGARSPAGALGLLQLLPATAARLAAAAGVPPARAGLSDPEVSLAAGALYLGLLADRFGHPAAALAAYNAGPRAAESWARGLARLPLDEWVEDLPFRETRRYVKAVLADAQLRRWLHAGAELAIDGLDPVPPPGEGVGF